MINDFQRFPLGTSKDDTTAYHGQKAVISTASFRKQHGIRVCVRNKVTDGDDAIYKSIRTGYISYIISTRAILFGMYCRNDVQIRRSTVEMI